MTSLTPQAEDAVLSMLGIKWIRDVNADLMKRLERIDALCQQAGGRLVSRQVIAQEILRFKEETK